jgi:tRNA U55 pseudouridine synthase TruB
LLLICTGNLQKKSLNFKVKPKEYTGTFFIEQRHPMIETEVDRIPIDHIEALIHETVKQFLGNRSKPPIFSISKDGIRLYEHAAGETVEIAFRKTTI